MSLQLYARLSQFAIILSDTFDKYLSLQICKCAPLTQATSITSVSQPSPKCQTWARRSRTAKASRISRHAVKSRCAHERDGWGRLSDDGPGHYNPDLSEGPWGGGVMILQGGAQSSLRPDTVRDNRCDYEAHEGRMQTGRRTAHAGSRLKPPIIGKAPLGKPAFQPYWGKPAVRNDRGDRGNVGIIRSPVRASILPDFHYSTSNVEPPSADIPFYST